MNLSRKLPLLTSTLVIGLCLALATTAVLGVNRMMARTGQAVDEALTDQVADQMARGAQREREQVLSLIDTAQRQLVATASSASILPVLRADRDDQLREQAIRPIAAGTLEIGRSVQAQIDQLGQALDSSVTTMRALITSGKEWSSVGEATAWETTDQTGRALTVSLPPLTIGGVPILATDDPAIAVPQVDEPARLASALVTIFQRADDDRMVRIATTVNRNGKRAIRTAIAPTDKDGTPNPVLTEILAGRSYRGLAWVVDRWCVTAYQPLVAEGRVIGMLFAGKPVLDLPGLTESIGRQRYGATGYAVLVDASGRLVTHPKADLVGKHVIDELHLDGLKPMLTAPADGTIGTCIYTHEGRGQFGCFFKLPYWKWTVLATGFVDEMVTDLLAQTKARMGGELELLCRTAQVTTADGAQPLFSQLRLLDATGVERILIREGKQVTSTRRVEAPWFTTAMANTTATGLPHRLEISVNTKKPELRITVPIRHGGAVAGVLAANLDWSVIQRAIGGHHYGKTGYPWIVNTDGVLVTHPKYSLGDGKNLTAPGMGELGERIRQVLATGEPWHGSYAFEGVQKYSAMLPLAIGPERGVIATTAPEEELLGAAAAMATEMQTGRQQMTWLLVAVSFVVAAGGVIGAIWYVRRLLAPILRTEQVLGILAQGDLTGRLTGTGNDEFGRMAQALDRGLGALGGALGEISRNSQSIAGAAEELTAVSKQMNGNASAASYQAGQAAAAATEVATNIQTCAAGIEEMTASVGEIAQNAGQAATVAQEGVAAAHEADATMSRLGASSVEIGSIVKLITGISEQTNLLALNATIEAARAGEHGRGFAVVAGEVKALARQTSEATADIGKRVASIQGDATSAQEVLRRIGGIVERIHALQASIAAAVEEQSATTKEIGGNLSQVAKAGSDISRNITAVADAAKESSSGAGETLKAATELAKLAAELRQAVGRFKT